MRNEMKTNAMPWGFCVVVEGLAPRSYTSVEEYEKKQNSAYIYAPSMARIVLIG